MELLEFFLEPARETGIHAGASGQYDMLVEFGSNVYCCCLDGLEKHFCGEIIFVIAHECEREKSVPAIPGCSTSTRWGWNRHSGAS
jgi:hypothetical protein